MSATHTTGIGQGFTTSYDVERTPQEVYDAVLDVRAWWTGEIEGAADRVGGSFVYRHPPQHDTTQRVLELEPGRRVVWLVTAARLTFVSQPGEWTGTRVVFDIEPAESGATLRFTHVGLVPDFECYGACSTGWQHYVGGSLRGLIETGRGLPDPW
jgi:uncharacterized protein YndB with AHSA1/START domain